MGRKINTITLTEEADVRILNYKLVLEQYRHKPCVEQEYCCYVLMVFLLMILLIK